jgi:hypothetical protein
MRLMSVSRRPARATAASITSLKLAPNSFWNARLSWRRSPNAVSNSPRERVA